MSTFTRRTFISIMVDKLIETLRIESEEEGMTQKRKKNKAILVCKDEFYNDICGFFC